MPCGPVQFSTRTKNRVLRLRDGQIGRRNGLRGLRSGQVQMKGDCALCDPGRYSDVRDAGACTACPRGYFGGLKETGRVSSATRALAAHSAMPWRCSMRRAASLARPGATRTFDALQSDSKAVIPCKACPRGRWSESVGLQESAGCVNCDVGRFSGVSALKNKSGCAACAAGKYSESVGVSDPNQCQGCPGGFQQPKEGQSFCLQCVPGQYQEEEAQPACQLCTSTALPTRRR